MTGEIYDSTSISAGAKLDFGAAYLSFTVATARYWRLDLTDASLTTLQVGRVFLGPKWTPSKNQMYGWSLAVPDPSAISKSYGGQSFADGLGPPPEHAAHHRRALIGATHRRHRPFARTANRAHAHLWDFVQGRLAGQQRRLCHPLRRTPW